MNNRNGILKRVAELGLILLMGASMSADAGFLGFGGDSWKEEVLLHDGSKIIAKRTLSYGGRREVGQGAPIKEQSISFTLPNSNKTVTWTSEYSEDIGFANFDLLAFHVLNGTPYIVAEPNLCLSYNKWGRPNPPYVFFKYDGKEWKRISLSEFPVEFKTFNVVIGLGRQSVEVLVKQGLVSAETIKQRNGELTQYPQYQTLMRKPMPNAGKHCAEMVYDGNGGWVGIDWFKDQPSYAACLQFCKQRIKGAQYCLCDAFFKGK